MPHYYIDDDLYKAWGIDTNLDWLIIKKIYKLIDNDEDWIIVVFFSICPN